MKKDQHNIDTCQVCHQNKALSQLLPASMVRGGVLGLISEEHPDWKNDGYICYTCLNQYRTAYVQQLMEKDLGELDELEQEVVKSLQDNALLSENLNEEYEKTLTFGDRLSDMVGGLWRQLEIHHLVLCLSCCLDPHQYGARVSQAA